MDLHSNASPVLFELIGQKDGQRTGFTTSDVARLAKVSQSAVSRTFTPGASVSENTKERVLAAARELGYRPNALASAMRGRSHLIAVLVAYLDNQFYPIVLEQLSRALQAKDYQVLLFMTDPGNQDQMVQKMLQYQVEGIVMASATMSSMLARECAEIGDSRSSCSTAMSRPCPASECHIR